MADGTKRVDKVVGEIAAASQEQSQGIEQINKTVSDMDRVVQKNTASAEETASASGEMSALAETMKGFVMELVALVGGRNGNGKMSSELGVRSLEIWKPGENGDGKRPGVKKRDVKIPASNLKGLKPEQVIPMEGGSFKEF